VHIKPYPEEGKGKRKQKLMMRRVPIEHSMNTATTSHVMVCCVYLKILDLIMVCFVYVTIYLLGWMLSNVGFYDTLLFPYEAID